MDGSTRPFLDAVLCLSLLLLVVIALLRNNPPAEESDPPPGQLMMEIRWPDEIDTDVDLWVRAPGEQPVGYSNKSEPTFNLLRDDLGHVNDWLEINYENVFSRGAPDGEYVANVHLYRDRSGVFPIMVLVRIWLKFENTTITIHEGEVRLDYEGQEVTAAVFALRDMALIEGSVHDTQIPLRSPYSYDRSY